jgi:hypothetical protein
MLTTSLPMKESREEAIYLSTMYFYVRRITQEGTRIGLIVAVLLWTENYARRTLIGLLEQRPLTELVKSNESINGPTTTVKSKDLRLEYTNRV